VESFSDLLGTSKPAEIRSSKAGLRTVCRGMAIEHRGECRNKCKNIRIAQLGTK
jgi:hypothetical protein